MAEKNGNGRHATVLVIKDWSKHQHYKDRRPPWIKLYGALLDDSDFLALPEATQAQLIKLWLLASRMGHPLPDSPKLLAGKIGANRIDLDSLFASGLLARCKHAASETLDESLDKSYENARPLVQSTERETTTTSSSAREALLQAVPNRTAWEGIIAMALDGANGVAGRPTPDQLESACLDYMAGNHHLHNPSPRHFRAFLRRAVSGEGTTTPPRRTGGVGNRSYENAREALAE